MKPSHFSVLVKSFFIFLSATGMAISSYAQCPDGASIFVETFGGSFSSVDIGPAIRNGTSAYTYSGGAAIADGQYGIRKRTGGINGWVEGRDHTGQGGYMMLVKSKTNIPTFYEAVVKGFCRPPTQAVCFAAASLNRKGSGRDVAIHVQVKGANDDALIANYTSPVLAANDSISWNTYSFTYPLPATVSSVRITFSLLSNSVPDDFAIDDIRVINVGVSGANGNESGQYPLINGKYDYPVFACLNERVTFTMPSDTLKNKDYQWERMRDDYTYEAIPGATGPYFVIDAAQRDDSRFYRARMADKGSNPGCAAPSSPIGLYVDPQPVIETNAPICEGNPLDIAVNVSSSVTWTHPDGRVSTGKRISIQNPTIADSGLYKARVYFNTSCALTVELTASISVTGNPIKLSLPQDTTICKGRSLLLDATNPGARYTWSTGDSSGSIVVKDEGIYTVYINNEKNCNQRSATNVRIISAPTVLMRSDTILCEGDSLVLQPAVKDAALYRWSTGATTPAISVSKKGNYSLQAVNNCGAASAAVNIGVVRCSEDLLVPAAFTPNKDGLNDVFRPVQDASIQRYNMKIYSRWGQPVFSSYDISRGWDGSEHHG